MLGRASNRLSGRLGRAITAAARSSRPSVVIAATKPSSASLSSLSSKSNGSSAIITSPTSTSAVSTNVTSTPSTSTTPISTSLSTRSISTAPRTDVTEWKSDIQRTDCGIYVDRGLPRNFNKILIANRGEIACRIIRTCKQLGVRTVAVYSDADANSMFVKMADEAYNIGPAPSAQSYLRGNYLIELAKKVGAEAIHPGYGFLSENAEFAESCFAAGIEFIGPPTGAITAMGSKSASKNIMLAAGVACVPGYHGEDQSDARLQAEADKTGYPLMLKAVSGGGGKGMRIVRKKEDFMEALEGCRGEAMASFKDDRVLLERYIENPRHIEFQIFADKHGNVVHLFERDCSVQRRHQKVFEEAPAPGMSEELREQMGESAKNAARAVGYVGAGTVEFIFDADTGEYFFMEMNTRLQVEHCVSEMIVQRDLVQWQLHVAAGYRLPVVDQSLIQAKGHALELRVYAENPHNNFFPETGKLVHLSAPALAHDVRVETGVRQGDEVSVFYDPMIAKLVVWGPDRDLCIKRMLTALEDYHIVGPPTNIDFAQRVLHNADFLKGQVTTKYISTHLEELVPPPSMPPKEAVSLALIQLLFAERKASHERATLTSAAGDHFPSQDAWVSSSSTSPSTYRINTDAVDRTVQLLVGGQAYKIGDKRESLTVKLSFPKHPQELDLTGPRDVVAYATFDHDADATPIMIRGSERDGKVHALVGDRFVTADVIITPPTETAGSSIHVFGLNGGHFVFNQPYRVFGANVSAGGGAIAPMTGKITKINVKVGQKVTKGQPVVVMQAMKLEHIIRAGQDGVVTKVLYNVDGLVQGGQPVVVISDADAQE